MTEELLVSVAELGDLMHLGDLVHPDHPLALAKPSLFEPYRPPAPVTIDGAPVGPKTVVARESFATGDTLVRLGELYDPKARIVRRVAANFVLFAPPQPIPRGDD